MIFDLAECEEIVGHSFRDKQILRTAFTHTSYANEHNTQSYERMEYLGDALLDFFVAEYLYRKYPGVDEGELTTRRAAMVAKTPLKKIAQGMNLGSFVLLGEGMRTAGEASDKILSSLIESAIAALYLDGGIDAARKFVEERVLANSESILKAAEDSKSELQEYVQKYKLGALSYEELKKSGPDHSPTFESRVLVAGKEIARGKGAKKQLSEQAAARAALAILKQQTAQTVLPSQKGAKQKNKHPKEVRVLSLVSNYEKSATPTPSLKRGKKKQKQTFAAYLESVATESATPQEKAPSTKKKGAEKNKQAVIAPAQNKKANKKANKNGKKGQGNQPHNVQKQKTESKGAATQKQAAGKAPVKATPKKKKLRFTSAKNSRPSDGTPLV